MANNQNSLDQRTFERLRRLYIIALSTIALSVIVSQILIKKHLKDQESDSRIINVAGRQRMLSQKLTKEILALSTEKNSLKQQAITDSLRQTLQLWETSHNALQNGNDSLGLPGNNSKVIMGMFNNLNPTFKTIKEASENIIHQVQASTLSTSAFFTTQIQKVTQSEGAFLVQMDSIVNQYDKEAKAKVAWLRKLETFLMGFTLVLLLAEFLFIFWPTAKTVKKSISELILAEEKAKEMAYNADVLSEAKEKSIKELRALSHAMDETLLFARITPSGRVLHMGKKFSKLFKLNKFNSADSFAKVLSGIETEQETIENLIDKHKKIGWQGEVKATTKDAINVWLELSMIPFNPTNERSELLIIASDITKRKEGQLEIERLTKASFEEKMNQQKIVSSKIIENQEKEQNRIAKDVHDGIGQMLTGLKYNLESIDSTDVEKTSVKVEHLKELTANIIKGVRTATFNLTPPELADHGIVPALAKLTQELARLTGKEILLFNKTDFNERLDSLTEINIYRITQEAINNAIKYANSSHIIVSLASSKNMLSIVVDDNGKGFEPSKVKNIKKGDGGMGLTFMKERIKYINGRLFINSEPGSGTRVTLNIPLQTV
ncbi:histidine kinase [Seonamhaeicola algicola]|uniref:Oxygen sensor histidine kinase NreB n=1 Tax=Seonamhaeicola algicola TaxID=1719036 RepID=A0A5C7B501_9FLAO|nr:type IV pili methyl-accepting chemotaxis transducer N-terminal domain-containing protein [Seonamhaeicola algicola]TXE14973.1 histidine kinase [Seonamhaeicola algicola]